MSKTVTEVTFAVRGEVGGKPFHFDAPAGSNLLGAALKNKVRLDHICRVGLCGTCQVCIREGGENAGRATEAELLLLDTAPLDEGVRLACQVSVDGELTIWQ